VPGLRAADDAQKPTDSAVSQEQQKVAAEYKALDKEFSKVWGDLNSRLRTAKTAKEKEALQQEKTQKGHEFAARFLQLVEKYPASERSFDFLVFAASAGTPEQMHRALELMAEHHASGLSTFCQDLAKSPLSTPEEALRDILAKATDPKVKGAVTLGMARFLKAKSERIDLSLSQAMKFSQEAENLYSNVLRQSDVNKDTLEEIEGEFWDLQHLGVGKKAPEISGRDDYDQQFKLSDYQGKVVMLDFWATT
jgi:AhpC/TSA family